MNTLLTLDLNGNVPSATRAKMYEALGLQGWKKVTELTTLWKKAWANGSLHSAYENAAFAEVAAAAKAANIVWYDATVNVTPNEPKTLKVAPPMAVHPAVPRPSSLMEQRVNTLPPASVPRIGVPVSPLAAWRAMQPTAAVPFSCAKITSI